MPGSILGTSVRRVEDPELIRGHGTYVDNIVPPGALHVVFVRSPLAHARLEAVDVAKAREAPGVVAVLTGADLADLPDHRPFMVLNDACARPLLARGKVRFVGDMVAAVVATTRAEAVDASELVEVDYDPLPAVVDAEAALTDGAPLQFEELGSNLASGVRDPDDVHPLEGADVVVRARIVNQRLAVAPMEGNSVTALPGGAGGATGEGADDTYDMTVQVSTQMPHGLRDQVARQWGWEPERVHVVAPHVGGGFGGKAGLAPEHAVVIEAARRLGRPVTWTETRSENLTAMPHGRGQVQYGELGLRRDGTIVGLRARVVGDAGAYAGFGGALALGPTRNMAQGVYRIPTIAYDAAAALTTTTPMGAFRGAGRPEAAAMLERLMDLAARELDMDPAELRRRNFLAPEDFPLTTVTGSLYDSGEYAKALDKALEIAGYDELRRRAGPPSGPRRPGRARHRPRGLRRGHRRGSGAGVREGQRRRRRRGHGRRRDLRARAGARDVVRDDRRRPARHPDGGGALRPVRHRGRAARRRDRRVAVAAAGRVERARRGGHRDGTGARGRGDGAGGLARRRRGAPTTVGWGSPACRTGR